MNNSFLMVVLRGIDILAATWIWRDYDITISSLTGLELRKPKPRKWAVVLGWILNHIQKNHCELAIISDLARALTTVKTLENGNV